MNSSVLIENTVLTTPNTTTPAPLVIHAVTRNAYVPDRSLAALSHPHPNSARAIEEVPLSLTVISSEEIAALRLHDLGDVLVYFAGASVLDTYGNGTDVGSGAQTYSRGNAIAVYVDGSLLNDGMTDTATLLHYSARDIDHIEMFTPSAPYPQKYTKVIYVFTKNSTSGPSYNMTVSAGNKGFGALGISVTGLSFGDAIHTSWYIDRTLCDGIRRYDSLFQHARLSGRTTFELSERSSVDWVFRYGTTYQEYPGMLDEDQLADDRNQSTTPHSGAENYLLSNALTWQYAANSRTALRGTVVSARSIDDTQLTFREKAWAVEEWLKTEDRTLVNVQVARTLDTFPGTFTAGIEHIQSDTELTRHTIKDGVRTAKLEQIIFPRTDDAFFGQVQSSWLEHGELVYGLRAERTGLEAFTRTPSGKDDWELEEKNVHSFAGISYTVFDRWQLFMNTHGSSVLDPYAMYTDRSLQVGEKTYSEYGFNYSSYETLLSKRTSRLSSPWRAQVSFFSIDTLADIFWLEGRPTNIDSIRRGIECSVRGQILAQWNAFIAYTGQDAYFSSGEYSGKKVPMVPSMVYSAGLTYMPIPAWTITVIERYTAEQWAWNDVENVQEHLKAYDLIDLRTDYRWEDITFFLNVNNLFDKKYEISETYLSFPAGTYYIPGARRMWECGVTYAF